MKTIRTYNQISVKGLDRLLAAGYEVTENTTQPDAVMLRSYKMQVDDILPTVKAIGRAGAGVNNIPLEDCTRRGIPVFNAPGANANAVKELVLAGTLWLVIVILKALVSRAIFNAGKLTALTILPFCKKSFS